MKTVLCSLCLISALLYLIKHAIVDMHSENFVSFAGVQDADLSVLSQTMAQCCKNIKETVQMLASRHKDIHGSVSKVGKAIDRVRTGCNFLWYCPFGILDTSPLVCFYAEF